VKIEEKIHWVGSNQSNSVPIGPNGTQFATDFSLTDCPQFKKDALENKNKYYELMNDELKEGVNVVDTAPLLVELKKSVKEGVVSVYYDTLKRKIVKTLIKTDGQKSRLLNEYVHIEPDMSIREFESIMERAGVSLSHNELESIEASGSVDLIDETKVSVLADFIMANAADGSVNDTAIEKQQSGTLNKLLVSDEAIELNEEYFNLSNTEPLSNIENVDSKRVINYILTGTTLKGNYLSYTCNKIPQFEDSYIHKQALLANKADIVAINELITEFNNKDFNAEEIFYKLKSLSLEADVANNWIKDIETLKQFSADKTIIVEYNIEKQKHSLLRYAYQLRQSIVRKEVNTHDFKMVADGTELTHVENAYPYPLGAKLEHMNISVVPNIYHNPSINKIESNEQAVMYSGIMRNRDGALEVTKERAATSNIESSVKLALAYGDQTDKNIAKARDEISYKGKVKKRKQEYASLLSKIQRKTLSSTETETLNEFTANHHKVKLQGALSVAKLDKTAKKEIDWRLQGGEAPVSKNAEWQVKEIKRKIRILGQVASKEPELEAQAKKIHLIQVKALSGDMIMKNKDYSPLSSARVGKAYRKDGEYGNLYNLDEMHNANMNSNNNATRNTTTEHESEHKEHIHKRQQQPLKQQGR
jgi:hypothetical protein